MPPSDDDGSTGGGERERKRVKPAAAAPPSPPPPTASSALQALPPGRTTRAALHQQRLERSTQVLFYVLEQQRRAAREARAACRRRFLAAAEGPVLPTWAWELEGGGDEDGEEGAVTGAGWWPSEPEYMHRADDRPPRGRADSDAAGLREWGGWPRFRAPAAADRAFLDTCSAAALACKAWRSVALAATDRATAAWEGKVVLARPEGVWKSWWQRGARSSRDPLAALRLFRGGVLRALCVRGEPVDASRLRAFARALGVVFVEPPPPPGGASAAAGASAVGGAARAAAAGARADRADEAVAGVLRGLKVLRLERAEAFVDAFSPSRLRAPLPSPPLLSSVVSLDLERWRSAYQSPGGGASPSSLVFSRENLPSLRSLHVSLLPGSNCPFCFFNGASDAAAAAFLPPPLTRIVVDAIGDVPSGKLWPRGSPLLVSARSLVALSPTLLSLSTVRAAAAAIADGDGDGEGEGASGGGGPSDARAPQPAEDLDGRVPLMARLVPCLSQLTRLTNLELDSEYDWSPYGDRRQWLLSARAVLASLAQALRKLELGESGMGGNVWPAYLPPAISLLTALTSLRVRGFTIPSVGSLRRCTGLRRLVIEVENTLESHEGDEEEFQMPHPPLLDRDLAALSMLTHLELSHTARCYAPVFESGLPHLAAVVVCGFASRRLMAALRTRMERDGLAVFRDEVAHYDDEWPTPPKRLSAAAFDEIERSWAEGGGSDDEGEHDALHQALLEKVAREEEEDAAAVAGQA